MNPNSAHQMWSKWTFTVRTDRAPTVAQVRDNCARFGRKAFGSATQMRISHTGSEWRIEARTEGAPVHAPDFVTFMYMSWRRFLRHGFGHVSTVTCDSTLEAGSRQDGTPADQLVILPVLVIEEQTWTH